MGVSASYVLVSLGVSAALFGAFHALHQRLGVRPPLLEAWGQNPLLLYVLHQVLLGFYALPGIPAWYVAAPAWLVVVQALALLAALSGVALWLDRRGWMVRL